MIDWLTDWRTILTDWLTEAVLRDFPEIWHVEQTLGLRITIRFSDFYEDAVSKSVRLPREKRFEPQKVVRDPGVLKRFWLPNYSLAQAWCKCTEVEQKLKEPFLLGYPSERSGYKHRPEGKKKVVAEEEGQKAKKKQKTLPTKEQWELQQLVAWNCLKPVLQKILIL